MNERLFPPPWFNNYESDHSSESSMPFFFFFFPVIEKKKENTLSGMTKHFPSTLHLKFRNTPVCRTHFCCLITLATFYYMKLNGWKITDNNVATPFLFS